jgi:hypothetical protein
VEAKEDTSGGSKHGGWHLPFAEEASQTWVVRNLNEAGGFDFGRRTYEAFAGHWPNAPEDERTVANPLNKQPK